MRTNRIYHPLVVALAEGGRARANAVREIRAALKAADGVVGHAADRLKCDRRTLTRWLSGLDAEREYAASLRAKANKPGRK